MQEPDLHSQGLTDAFAKARRELSAVESVRPMVERRLATAAIRPARRMPRWFAAAAAGLILVIGAALWLKPRATTQPPRNTLLTADASLQLGDAKTDNPYRHAG